MRPRLGFKKGPLLAAATLVIVCALPAFSGQPCARCHPREVQGFLATAMAHSMGPPSRGPSGAYYHSVSGTRFTIHSRADHMTQRMERDGLASQYSIAYSVGSGAHAVSYVIQVGNHLFESPLSYYAASACLSTSTDSSLWLRSRACPFTSFETVAWCRWPECRRRRTPGPSIFS